MLKIIEGGFHSPARDEMIKEILRLTEKRERVYLIVPEQQTLLTEKEMASLLPAYAPLCFEVTNFTRLANTVFRTLGGISASYSDRSKEALVMWRTLTELSPMLSLTRDGKEVSSGLVKKALAAVYEMKSLSVGAEDLATLLLNDKIKSNARLERKLSDLSKIMALYNKLLCEKYADISEDAEKVRELVERHPDFFSSAEIFIDGFTSFTEPQRRLIGALLKYANISVHLAISKSTKDSFEFSELIRTRESLIKLADKLSVEKKLVRYDGNVGCKSELLYEVGGLLWHNFSTASEDTLTSCEDIRIYEAQDPYEECDFIASDIKRRVMEGESFSDFSVIGGSIEDYLGILDSSFEEAGIPAFVSKHRDASSFEAIKLIYAAFATVEGGFKREDVISYMKCGISGISREACDEFELYVDKWQINKSRFTDGIAWNMSPDGYSSRPRPDSVEHLLRINETKERLIAPLIEFSEDTKGAGVARELAEALMRFLSRISLEDRIIEKTEELLAIGEREAADENSAIWQVICDALDTIVEVIGDIKIDLPSFEALFKTVISQTNLGKIPSYSDQVTVGTAEMLRTSKKKHVYLIGVNKGKFPLGVKEGSFFTERDKLLLSTVSDSFLDDGEILYARELYSFSRAFSTASESVTLTYSARSSSFAPLERSEIIDRICVICREKVKPCKISDLKTEDRLYFPALGFTLMSDCPDAVKNEISEALQLSGHKRDAEIYSMDIDNLALSLSADAGELLYPSELSLTQSRIDSFVACPFAYYLNYNLGLSENERVQFDARNIGTFIHAVLEHFFNSLGERKANELTDEERHEAVGEAARKYLASISDSESMRTHRAAAFIERMKRYAIPIVDGICEELKGCDFVPKFFELKIERDNPALPSAVTIKTPDGKSTYVYGTIDRVDAFNHEGDVYVRVIDYKTGKKSFSPSDLDENKNLQMFLYLKAIEDTKSEEFKKALGVSDSGKIIPAGVVYIKTDMSDVKISRPDKEASDEAIQKNQGRQGMLLGDPIAISATNPNYSPVKFNKSGEPSESSKKYLYTRDEWVELTNKITKNVGEISMRMRGGDISTTSAKKDLPCSYCKFKAVCRKKVL